MSAERAVRKIGPVAALGFLAGASGGCVSTPPPLRNNVEDPG